MQDLNIYYTIMLSVYHITINQSKVRK